MTEEWRYERMFTLTRRRATKHDFFRSKNSRCRSQINRSKERTNGNLHLPFCRNSPRDIARLNQHMKFPPSKGSPSPGTFSRGLSRGTSRIPSLHSLRAMIVRTAAEEAEKEQKKRSSFTAMNKVLKRTQDLGARGSMKRFIQIGHHKS